MMRPWGLLGAWVATLYTGSPSLAWNATGHRIIAAIAYERLNPGTRARVDLLLKHHPDYATLLTRDSPPDPEARARAAFLAASVWPDHIKGDRRFYDDTRKDATPTPLLPGFPDMARHTNWHYYDIPYAPDGAQTEKQPPPNALSELRRLLRETGTSPRDAYDLPWLIHLAGDVHQPLHCTSRFLKSQPKGDAGGNGVIVAPGGNLHFFWDSAAGSDGSDAYITRFAAEVTHEYPVPRRLSKDPKKWIEEGFEIDKREVYSFGLESGSREHPIELSQAYQANAKRQARERIALAGYRLAAVLNEKLKRSVKVILNGQQP
jgi:hypothetical protein